jgi:hypothetical protein
MHKNTEFRVMEESEERQIGRFLTLGMSKHNGHPNKIYEI